MSLRQQRFGLDVQFVALVNNFNNIFSIGHLYLAGQSINSLPSQILDRYGQPIQTFMKIQKRYEILDGLPAYGPMYIPVSVNFHISFSEGFVVKFYKSDNTEWVANFKSGYTDFSLVVDYPDQNKIVVIAF